jgi:NAD(P)-dependent dehydrogenase (short-subunit alcohol dehydrogenase family)
VDHNQVAGLRVLVVGASSGIGSEVASQLAAKGALVAACARRRDRLEELSGAAPLECDVQDPAQCAAVVADAVRLLGGLDALVYVAGITRITPLERSGYDDWLEIFATNVFGAALIARAAIPSLSADDSQGRALFITSDAASLAMPGLVSYAASKAALARFCQGLASEFPALAVTEVVVGPTAGTEVADKLEPEEFIKWATRWYEEGYIRHGMLHSPDVANMIVDTLLSHSPPAQLIAAAPEDETATSLEESRRHAEAEP